MSQYKPPSSPPCWGLKYQDGEKECEQCKYNDTCRPAMFSRLSNPSDQRTSLPVIRTYSPPPVPSTPPHFQVQPSMQQAIVPLPAKPYYPPPVNSIPLPRVQAPVAAPSQSQTAQTVSQATQYYQQSTGWSLPSNANPNPMAPMHRPGAPSPAYYFTQYPTESVASRVGKNLLLRAAEAIFAELMQFFRHWTWPPR
jgi:hypothetical protein